VVSPARASAWVFTTVHPSGLAVNSTVAQLTAVRLPVLDDTKLFRLKLDAGSRVQLVVGSGDGSDPNSARLELSIMLNSTILFPACDHRWRRLIPIRPRGRR
jgi:hypothetical protein